MGTVFRASHQRTGKLFAVKTAPATKPEGEALIREATLLSNFEHRGVTYVVEHGTQDGFAWMAMQFVEGRTLRSIIAERAEADHAERITDNQLQDYLVWFRDFATTLHALHERGFVHRDVKPANLMIADDGACYLIDFGLSLDVGKDPIVHALAGTIPYMSPEQVLSITELDRRTDVYSLAASFYELISGRPVVLTHEARVEVFAEIAFGRVRDVSAIVPGLPRGCDAILRRALEKKPAARYATALDLAEDVDCLLGNRPLVHAQEPLRAKLKRHRLRIAILVALSFVVSLLAFRHWRQTSALGDLRQRLAAGRSDPLARIEAMELALSLLPDWGDSQEFRDLHERCVVEFAPELTRTMFQRAALAVDDLASRTFSGRIGALAAATLSTRGVLPAAALDELAVQSAFASLRSAHFDEAATTVASRGKTEDERLRLLGAIAALLSGRREHIRDIVDSLGTNHGNLSVDRLCCRAFLMIEAVGKNGGPTPGHLAALASALEERLADARRNLEARNLLASLLALTCLELDKPEAAQLALESRLADPATGPQNEERPAMAVMAAVAGFRAVVQGRTGPAQVERVVEHLREATLSFPALMDRFCRDAARGLTKQDAQRLYSTAAALFEGLLAQGPPPGILRGPAVHLLHFATQTWYERHDMRPFTRYAELAANEARPTTADDPAYAPFHRLFWLTAIHVAARVWPSTEPPEYLRDLSSARRLHAVACVVVPEPHVEFDAMLALAVSQANPDDRGAAAELVVHTEKLRQRVAQATGSVQSVLQHTLQTLDEHLGRK